MDNKINQYQKIKEIARNIKPYIAVASGYMIDSINLLGYNKPHIYDTEKNILDSIVYINPKRPWTEGTRSVFYLHTLALPKDVKFLMSMRMLNTKGEIVLQKEKIVHTAGANAIYSTIPKASRVHQIILSIKSESSYRNKKASYIIDSLSFVRYKPRRKNEK